MPQAARYLWLALGIAFASSGHGLLHFWDQTEPRYQEFLNSQDAEMLRDADEERRIDGEEQSRLTVLDGREAGKWPRLHAGC